MLERTACRFVVFLVVFLFFGSAGKIAGNDARNIYSSRKQSITVKLVGALCFAAGLALSVLAVCELIKGNPNEWTLMKIFFYLTVWSGTLTVFFARYSYVDMPNTTGWSKRPTAIVLIGSILTTTLCVCFCCGGVAGMTYPMLQ